MALKRLKSAPLEKGWDMKKLILGSALMLGGCHIADVFETPAQSYVTPDGRSGYVIRCGGIASSITDCYAKARALCGGRDYDLLDKNISPRDDTATENRSIEIACKA